MITTTVIDVGSVGASGTFAANSVLGAVTASIESSSVTTTNSGDVQVLAGDSSVVDARAQAGSTSTGGSISGAVAGAFAINAIGWQGATSLLAASVNALLGTAYWTTEQPSNVTAKIVGSTVTAAGALLVSGLADGVINSTVSNVAAATGAAIGGSKTAAAGGVAATNKVSRTASAFIDNTGVTASKPVSATGSVTIDAENNSTISSNSTLITSADATTDGATKLAELALDKIFQLALSTHKPSDGIQTLQFGDKVQLIATYDTAHSLLFDLSKTKKVTINPGDTVHVSKGYPTDHGAFNQIYVYKGPTTANFDLESANYKDTSLWAPVAGVNGAIYKFMGANNTSVNLATGTPALVDFAEPDPELHRSRLSGTRSLPRNCSPPATTSSRRWGSRSAASWCSTRCTAAPAPMCLQPT